MYTIHIVVHSPDKYTEILADSLESAAYIVEEHISLALLEIFGSIFVDTVKVIYSSSEDIHTLPPGI
jgi:hypothetical protein